jgi:CheY-like chemotaxis protein
LVEVLAGVRDLLFREKIDVTARQGNISIRFALPSELERLTLEEKPKLIILDLEEEPEEYLSLVRRFKSRKTDTTPKIVGYLSHVNVALREQALQAGCDAVFSRSTFSRDLPQILKTNSKQGT